MLKVPILIFLYIMGSVQLKESDHDNTVFDDIIAVNDSTKHQYVSVREGDNWCWLHNNWENVRIVSSKIKEDREKISLNQ